jgi:hypothetical protein
MRTINTTRGVVNVPLGEARHINTSRVVEEDLTYEDEEPEILAVLPAGCWCARVGDDVISLAAFVALDSGRMYGVKVGMDGRVDLVAGDVEKDPRFVRYEQANQENKEK